jgi:hypothetical protein
MIVLALFYPISVLFLQLVSLLDSSVARLHALASGPGRPLEEPLTLSLTSSDAGLDAGQLLAKVSILLLELSFLHGELVRELDCCVDQLETLVRPVTLL